MTDTKNNEVVESKTEVKTDTELVKGLNIYQKLAILQDKVKVNKDNRNDFADFKYRTIQNILAELKPLLKELGLIIRFGSGKLDGEKYILDIIVTDINNPTNQMGENGEIYIDRTKSKMDLSQKVLSAKTFLKKSLLEDLLLISEDVDPDSHDNTGLHGDNFRGGTAPTNQGNTSNGDAQTDKNRGNNKGNTTNNSTEEPERTPEEAEAISGIKNILYLVAEKDPDKMLALLAEHTSFIGKDKKKVPGVSDYNKLIGKRLTVTYGKLQKTYPKEYEKVLENKAKKNKVKK